MKLKQKFVYKNSSNNKINLMLEPWGENIVLNQIKKLRSLVKVI